MQKNKVCFAFYYNEFCCGAEPKIPLEEFEKYSKIAENMLLGMISPDYTGFENEVKLCICEIAEIIYQSESTRDIEKETIDGYSVTFSQGSKTHKDMFRIALNRLGRTGLMYAGVE